MGEPLGVVQGLDTMADTKFKTWPSVPKPKPISSVCKSPITNRRTST